MPDRIKLLEESINNSVFFTLNKDSQYSLYKRELDKLLINLYEYEKIRSKHRDIFENEYGADVVIVFNDCIDAYDSSKGAFMNYFNRSSSILSEDELSLLIDYLTKCTDPNSGFSIDTAIKATEIKKNEICPEAIDNLLSSLEKNEEISYKLSDVAKNINITKNTLKAILFSYSITEFEESDTIEKDSLLYVKEFFDTNKESIANKIAVVAEQYSKYREEKRAKEIIEKMQNPPEPLNVGYYAGDIISFGHYFDSINNTDVPLKWVVLDINSDCTLLSCDRIIEYDTYVENDNCLWIDSKVNRWLNNDFLVASFSSDIDKSEFIKSSNRHILSTYTTAFLALCRGIFIDIPI